MKYINEKILNEIGVDWGACIETVRMATALIKESKYSQPLKPYLRFNDVKNRIIAMPAYVGGDISSAGIKWIASFPDNIKHGVKRAHSVTVLNDVSTGKPVCIINSALISVIRTAAVSGFILEQYINKGNQQQCKKKCGIVGFGPIGQMHLSMLIDHFHNYIEDVYLYDVKGIDESVLNKYTERTNVVVVNSWEEVFDQSDVFITATVSTARYIDKAPKSNGIYLNVSLRDFEDYFLRQVGTIIVDNWDEVCRENTDIEFAHKSFGLSKEDVLEITDVLDKPLNANNQSLMFNPMGMAVYDIAISKYYYNLSDKLNAAIILED